MYIFPKDEPTWWEETADSRAELSLSWCGNQADSLQSPRQPSLVYFILIFIATQKINIMQTS